MISTRLPTLFALGVAFFAPATAEERFTGPPQAARGRDLFFTTAKPMPCGTCHNIGGNGTAVGPDLTRWSKMSPRVTGIAISSTVTENVLWIQPKQGAAFPALKTADGGYQDLSQNPPVLRKLAAADTASIVPNSTWKHPPGLAKPTLEQLADVVSFIRWSGAKDGKPVKPEEVE